MGVSKINNGIIGGGIKGKKRKMSSTPKGSKTGRWTQTEKSTFLMGLKKFGKGKWKEISGLLPTRTTIQVKTHAQMVLKRAEAGEDIFAALDRHRTIYIEERLVSSRSNDASTEHEPGPTHIALSQWDQLAAQILFDMARVSECTI